MDEQEPDSKRLWYAGKRPPQNEDGCAVNSFWDGVFSRIDTQAPRVGKRVFTSGSDFDEIQRGIVGIKVRRVEACRGTERLTTLSIRETFQSGSQ